ncbi:MAG: phenylalanine--tRNA ligase subunit beta, partial [Steroidobacteraceae bacterium]
MRVSYQWLGEWVPIPWDARELGERLTMAGFEVEAVALAAPAFTGVVVAEILETAPHPKADKLRVCRVSTGRGEPRQIVCGAANASAGLLSALAEPGAVLPGGVRIETTKLRGIESQGMLCSGKELGLDEASAGILELPPDAPAGVPLREYLALDDAVLEINVTANRGDAQSILGIAREVAALGGRPLAGPAIDAVAAHTTGAIAVYLDAAAACPKFAGRVIRGVNNHAPTPCWMRERLRRAGLRSLSAVVDVTNYVMLELGQPMHAYDVAHLRGDVRARLASAGESIQLLDGRTVALEPDMLVIADAQGAIGIAGIMGGKRAAVSAATVDVFLESAYFSPEAIAGRPRRLASQSEASQRFERGVDPARQERALERATRLVLDIAGGSAGAVSVDVSEEHLPRRLPVRLRERQIPRLLGAAVDPRRVEAILGSLEMSVGRAAEGWSVTPPSFRFDIHLEADLIEEIARIEGYDAFAEHDAQVTQRFSALPVASSADGRALECLAARGYHEAITYAFVDPGLQARLFPDREALALSNPIASDLAVMRVSLWPGLLRAALDNERRQQDRVRLFERGARFAMDSGRLEEIDTLAGLALGPRLPEQWGAAGKARCAVDFFDVKADVESLLAGTGEENAFRFEAASISCLHPGR